jgi:P27 family predicted phage terminase small subunit
LDVPILEQTADCLSKLKRAQEILNEEDIMIVTQDRYGNPKKQEHPMVHAKNVYLSQFRALCTQLGLSPASRAQLAGAKMQKKEEDEDPVMQLVKQAKK